MLQGFLVVPSVFRNNTNQFIKKRIFRLYPSYIFTLILTVLIALYINSDINIREIYVYFIKELLLFRGSDFYGISNGAIWAVFIQLQVYFVCYLVARWLIKIDKFAIWLVIFVILLAINYLDKYLSLIIENTISRPMSIAYSYFFLRFSYFFYLGIMVYKFKDRIIPILSKYAFWLLLLHLIWHLQFIELPSGYCYTDPITVITSSLAAIGIAYRLKKIKLKYEISYDIYVWHMPVYTGLSLLFLPNGYIHIVLSIIVTIFFSFLSNYLSKVIVGYVK